MPDEAKATRVTQLLEAAAAALDQNELQNAAISLREATSLDPDNAKVKEAWDTLRHVDVEKGFIALVQEYLVGENEETAKEAKRAAAAQVLSPSDAQGALKILLGASAELKSVDSILGSYLERLHGQKALANRLQKDVTQTFQDLWVFGEESIGGLTSALLAAPAWHDEAERGKLGKDVCLLCLAKVLEPGCDKPEIAMGAIARLMAVDAHRLAPLIDEENLEILLNSLDILKPVVLRSQATLATAKFLKANPDVGTPMLKDYVITRISRGTNDDLVAAFSAAGAVFPIVPGVASPLFMASGFVEDLVHIVTKSKSKRLHHASLELLSAACVDKSCRDAISGTFRPWLQAMAHRTDEKNNSAIAALVLSKIQNSEKSASEASDDLVSVFKGMILQSDEDTVRSSVEGLAYTSVHPSVKETLAGDPTFLQNLFKVIETSLSSGPLLFGGMTIISNLTSYPPRLSAEQKRMAQLQAYANQSKPAEPDPLDDESHVTNRCSKMMDAKVVPLVVKCSKRATATTLNLIATIVLSLTKSPKHRGKAAQQGAFDMMLSLSSLDPRDDNALQSVKRHSAMALSRILISIDPSLVFNTPHNRPIATAVRSLHQLLLRADGTGPFSSDGNDGDELFTAFDALRAVTNLAGMNEETRLLIISQSFDAICAWLWVSASALTQAATECLTNLCLSDAAIAKLTSPEHKQNLTLLLAFTRDETKGTRYAAAAAFVHMTMFPAGVQALLDLKNGVARVVDLAGDEDDAPLKARADAIVENMRAAEGPPGAEASKRLAKAGYS